MVSASCDSRFEIFFKQMIQIGEKSQLFLLDGLNQTVANSTSLGPLQRITKEQVLPVDDKRIYQTFRTVIGYRNLVVFEEAYQFRSLLQAVFEPHAKQTFQYATEALFES